MRYQPTNFIGGITELGFASAVLRFEPTDSVGCIKEHGFASVVVRSQSTDGIGCIEQCGTNSSECRRESTGGIGRIAQHGSDRTVLLGQQTGYAGCISKHGSYIFELLRQPIVGVGRVEEHGIGEWSKRVQNASNSVTEAANKRLRDLAVDLETVNRQLINANGRERRQLINRRSRIERERQRQEQIISNAPTPNRGFGERIASGLQQSQYLLYGGAGAQAISTAVGGGAWGSGVSRIAKGMSGCHLQGC